MKKLFIAALAALALQSCSIADKLGGQNVTVFDAQVVGHDTQCRTFTALTTSRDVVTCSMERAKYKPHRNGLPKVGLYFHAVGRYDNPEFINVREITIQ